MHDIERNRLAEGHWPLHPLDDEGDEPRGGFKGLYLGCAGVLWALWYLQREGAAELGSDPREGIRQVDAAYQADPDTGKIVPSYYMGEVGILLVRWRLTGSTVATDRVYASIKSNIQNPANEAYWAAPGTMVAAWHLWQATGEGRWRDLFLRERRAALAGLGLRCPGAVPPVDPASGRRQGRSILWRCPRLRGQYLSVAQGRLAARCGPP